jgi:nucleotide-binding universal stress UspA family protein
MLLQRPTPERTATDSPDDWQTILVGYDGSEPAKRALARAGALANDRTRVVVIAVAEPYPRSGVTIPANEDKAEMQRRLRELDEANRFLAARGIEAETVRARGNPAEILADASSDADLVIVGGRKLSRLQRLLLRPVASRLVAAADCDVLVVP